MANRHQLDVVDRLLRTLCRANDLLFGGKVVIFAGDFRQVLPVVPRGSMGKIISMSMRRWQQWPRIEVLALRDNMRIRRLHPDDLPAARRFEEYLLKIGDGREEMFDNRDGSEANFIKVPREMVVRSLDDLCAFVFPDFSLATVTGNVIMAPRNSDVDHVNDVILAKMPGRARTYNSCDTVVNDDNAIDYPVEFLNELTIPGVPPHRLTLKVDCPIMLLRNLDAANGLCNGTRLLVKDMQEHVVECEIITGAHVGKRVFIPRITLTPSDTGLPFNLSRRQFPFKPCFGMTINKSQSQTLNKVGLYLPTHVFGHGQLYVAFSRVGRPDDIKVFVQEGKIRGHPNDTFTRNVAWTRKL